nr:PREDICTED: uncharacterized protein LOC105679427 [Linepithema humile]
MLLILKFVLIIILNVTYESITQDSEILLLPALNPTGMNEIPLTLKVFGKLIQLNLRRDDQTVLPASNVWKYNAKSIAENFSQSKASISCFYLHEDHVSFAAINFCQGNGLEGLVFVENVTLEIRPLRNDFALPSIIDDFCVKEQINVSFGKFHLIKTSVLSFNGLNLNHWNNFKPKRRRVRSTQEKITIELAVFFDEAAYRTFMPLLDNNKEKIRYMILAYVNRIQAIFHHSSLGVSIPLTLKVFGKLIQLNLRRDDQMVLYAFEVWKYNANDVAENFAQLKASNSCFYLHEDHVSFAAINFCQGNGLAILHHPSLGVSFDISLRRLEFMEKQPINLPATSSNHKKLLHLFCNYAEVRKPPNKNDPRYWDISLYLTGLELNKRLENDSNIYNVLGSSYTGGLCEKNFSCSIARFRATEIVSSGLKSSSTGAHEIGHV